MLAAASVVCRPEKIMLLFHACEVEDGSGGSVGPPWRHNKVSTANNSRRPSSQSLPSNCFPSLFYALPHGGYEWTAGPRGLCPHDSYRHFYET